MTELIGGNFVRCDHQDRIVTRDGADDLIEVFPVNRCRERVRVAGRGEEHHQILGNPNVEQIFVSHVCEAWPGALTH